MKSVNILRGTPNEEEMPITTLTEKKLLCLAGTQRNDAGRIVRYADDGRRNVWNDAVWHGKGKFNNKCNRYLRGLCSFIATLVANRTLISSCLQFGP